MATPVREVLCSVERLSTETGLWCADCLLSSGVRLWFTLTIGSQSPTLRSVERCGDCGGDRVEAS